jgi:hypothetical protein
VFIEVGSHNLKQNVIEFSGLGIHKPEQKRGMLPAV